MGAKQRPARYDAAAFADLLVDHESQVGKQFLVERHRPSHTFEAVEFHRVDVIHEIRAVVVANGFYALASANDLDSFASERREIQETDYETRGEVNDVLAALVSWLEGSDPTDDAPLEPLGELDLKPGRHQMVYRHTKLMVALESDRDPIEHRLEKANRPYRAPDMLHQHHSAARS